MTEERFVGDIPPLGVPVDGNWLVGALARMGREDAAWLDALGRFDAEGGWALDGALSCAAWLVAKARLARSTAYEKAGMARVLRARPVLAEAYRSGRISYCATRAIVRLRNPDQETDSRLVDLAEAGSVVDVERACGYYRRLADQYRRPADIDAERDVVVVPLDDGLVRIVATVSTLEGEEILATLRAKTEVRSARADSPAGDGRGTTTGGEPLGADAVGSACADSTAGAEAPRPWGARRADALMDLIRAGATAAAGSGADVGGADRYMVHLVRVEGQGWAETVDGRPVDDADAACVDCVHAAVTHHRNSTGSPLDQGRERRDWTTAQRREVLVRDGGMCRWPGCGNRIADIHHAWAWEDGGPTDLANAITLCRSHHRRAHQGFQLRGHPDGVMHFHRPDGTPIGTTTPLKRAADLG